MTGLFQLDQLHMTPIRSAFASKSCLMLSSIDIQRLELARHWREASLHTVFINPAYFHSRSH